MNQFQYTKEETILKVENVNVKLGGNQILKDVNLEIKDIIRPDQQNTGQIIGFLAPSGMGKTQLFETMSGLKPINNNYREKDANIVSGSVQVYDETKGCMVPVRPGLVGVVQQKYPLYPYKTVLGNLKLASKMKHGGLFPKLTQEETAKLEDLLDLFNLRDHTHKWPSQLSGGQRQRVAIAQQLLCSEHFLFMDEPFSGLDILMIKKVSQTIQKVANLHQKNTIIVVSHDIAATMAIADTIWLMGRERDTAGNIVPGAKILEEINLIDRGIAWQENPKALPQFMETFREIETKFELL